MRTINEDDDPARRNMPKSAGLLASALLGFLLCSCGSSSGPVQAALPELAPGVAFTNEIVPRKPWSIFVARASRTDGNFEIHSMHAVGRALGLGTLSRQVRALNPDLGQPFAAVSGDFYQRGGTYAGDVRGLQIIEGELASGPVGTAAMWIDASGAPHTAPVLPQFAVTWPNGKMTKFGLNEERSANAAVLFTPAIGASTRTPNGMELVLERDGTNSWLPLKVGETYSARVRDVREGGNTRLTGNVAVLSIGSALARRLPEISAGEVLKFSTATLPDLRGAKTAISGGPVLVRDGKRQKIDSGGVFDANSYSSRSMMERHPRGAVGWNDEFFYLVEVDGRQASSAGMTLEELADYFVRLGCTQAMNLDGGGSATIWCNGRLANSPCEGDERDIANGLVIVRKNVSRTEK
ncbi:MAG TPA: phosphodiester glycosidase family protein [Candidatus Eisenbacteria bacterium]|jgi:hypothetical protein|nr:phosphodiester glycosidase family protein [Candidatus Eisenbacteria bacterium]